MENNKTPTPSLAELIEAAQAEPNPDDDRPAKDVENWIKEKGIVPGNDLVDSNLLYRLYKAWSIMPVGRTVFGMVLGTVFDKFSTCYRIDKQSIEAERLKLLKSIGVRRYGQKKRIEKKSD